MSNKYYDTDTNSGHINYDIHFIYI